MLRDNLGFKADQEVLESVIDNTNSVIYIKNAQGQYVFINSKFEALFNITKQEAVGKTDYDIFPADIASSFVENDQWVMDHKQPLEIDEVARFQGVEKLYLTNKYPLFSEGGDFIGVCGISTDITEFALSKKKIIESENHYRTLVSNVQGVVYRCEARADWKMHYVSDYIQVLTGYEAESFIGNRDHTFASIIHPQDQKKVEETVFAALEKRQSYLISYRIIHKNGQVKWVHEKGQGLFEYGEEEVRFLDGVIIDITTEKEMEQALEQHNRELETIIAERTLHLQDANSLLQETVSRLKSTQDQLIERHKMIAIGSLVNGICHEINTPLGSSLTLNTFVETKIKDFLQGAEKKTPTIEKALDFVRSLEGALESNTSNLNKSIEIIENLKMISTIQTDQVKQPIQVCRLLDVIIKSFVEEYRQDQIRFHYHCDPSLILNSVPGLIYQIITLLIQNSVHHGFADQEAGHISVDVIQTDQVIVLDYADNGQGMSQDIVDRVFDPFFTTKMGQYSGLGLYTLYTIVTQKLGGGVVCTSEAGNGVRFRIELPV